MKKNAGRELTNARLCKKINVKNGIKTKTFVQILIIYVRGIKKINVKCGTKEILKRDLTLMNQMKIVVMRKILQIATIIKIILL